MSDEVGRRAMGCDPKNHLKHMCALLAQGLEDCVELLSDNPRVECRYCGIKANSRKNVCVAQVSTSLTERNTEKRH